MGEPATKAHAPGPALGRRGGPALGPAPRAATRDRAGLRGAAFLLALIVALFTGYAVGRAAGPDTPPPGALAGGGTATAGHAHGSAGPDVAGLAVSVNGYTLVADATAFTAGVPAALRFRVVGPNRAPVTGFVVNHDKPLHLVVVRRDLTGYQHLHPTMAADGTWSVPLTLPAPGTWRAYADFVVNDRAGAQVALTLGTDLTVAGAFQPAPPAAVARESTVDGYTVTYEGTPQPGATSPLLFRVFHSGQPVTDLQRYLGAYGHLVVLREGDLGYLHVHPETELAGGAIRFWLSTPSPGRYRAFLDFQTAGTVHTAQYALQVG